MEETLPLSMYKELAGYGNENEAPVVAPPATKKQSASRSAAKPVGKKSRPAKTPSTITSPNGLAKAMVILGVPCRRL